MATIKKSTRATVERRHKVERREEFEEHTGTFSGFKRFLEKNKSGRS